MLHTHACVISTYFHLLLLQDKGVKAKRHKSRVITKIKQEVRIGGTKQRLQQTLWPFTMKISIKLLNSDLARNQKKDKS